MKLCSHQSYLRVFNNEEDAYNRMFKHVCMHTQTYMLIMAYVDIHQDPREFLTCLWKYMKMMLVLHR